MATLPPNYKAKMSIDFRVWKCNNNIGDDRFMLPGEGRMKIQSRKYYDNLALTSLYLGILGFISSTWFFMLFNSLAYVSGGTWANILDWYWWDGGLVILIIPGSIISLSGMVVGMVARHHQGKYQQATAGIVLGAIGAVQFIFIFMILLLVGTW